MEGLIYHTDLTVFEIVVNEFLMGVTAYIAVKWHMGGKVFPKGII